MGPIDLLTPIIDRHLEGAVHESCYLKASFSASLVIQP